MTATRNGIVAAGTGGLAAVIVYLAHLLGFQVPAAIAAPAATIVHWIIREISD